jgi:bacteriocin-type transport-associated protein
LPASLNLGVDGGAIPLYLEGKITGEVLCQPFYCKPLLAKKLTGLTPKGTGLLSTTVPSWLPKAKFLTSPHHFGWHDRPQGKQADQENILAQALDVLSGDSKELYRFDPGEIIGDVPLAQPQPALGDCQAVEDTTVLSIPRQRLESKVSEDDEFAAHFYQAMAAVLIDRWHRLITNSEGRIREGQFHRDSLFIFSQFDDRDLDWIVARGQVATIEKGELLLHAGRPIEHLIIILEGKFQVYLPEEGNILLQAFDAISEPSLGKTIGIVQEGDLVGETAVLDNRPSDVNIVSLDRGLVLLIPRPALAIKLQQDGGFASRFYRAVAFLVSDRLRSLISRIGFGRRTYGEITDESLLAEETLSPDLSDGLYLAGTRFRWLLQQLRHRV